MDLRNVIGSSPEKGQIMREVAQGNYDVLNELPDEDLEDGLDEPDVIYEEEATDETDSAEDEGTEEEEAAEETDSLEDEASYTRFHNNTRN